MSDQTTNDEQAEYVKVPYAADNNKVKSTIDVIYGEPLNENGIPRLYLNKIPDEQAKYGTIEADGTLVTADGIRWKPVGSDGASTLYSKEDQPKTLLSNVAQLDHQGRGNTPEFRDGARMAMMFYEAQIASGELMVVKTALAIEMDAQRCCGNCGHIAEDYDGDPYRFCPGCGAKIIEA